MITAPYSLTSMVFGRREIEKEFFYTSAAVLSWALLSIYDIKKGGRVKQSWLVILMALASGLVVGGPGAVLVGAWAFREEALARRWPRKSTITNGSAEVKSEK